MYVIKVLCTVGVTFNVCDKGVLCTVGVIFNVCDKGVVYSRGYLQCM